MPQRPKKIVAFNLEPGEYWYVTCITGQSGTIYGPFDTKRKAEAWKKKHCSDGHVWKNRGMDG